MKARIGNMGGKQRHCLKRQNQFRKAKAGIELNVARDIKGKKKSFYKDVSD